MTRHIPEAIIVGGLLFLLAFITGISVWFAHMVVSCAS